MATRTRVILTGINENTGEKIIAFGGFAIKLLVQRTMTKNILNFKFPENWEVMTKRHRLGFLKKNLPTGWVLKLYQEPRKTRIGRSMYWQERNLLLGGRGRNNPRRRNANREVPPVPNRVNRVRDDMDVAIRNVEQVFQRQNNRAGQIVPGNGWNIGGLGGVRPAVAVDFNEDGEVRHIEEIPEPEVPMWDEGEPL